MIRDENKTEIIDQYLEGKLKGKLLEEVELRIRIDAQFRREVALQQKIIHTIREEHHAELKRELDALFGYEGFPEPENRGLPFYYRPRFFVTVSVTLMVASALYWWFDRPALPTYQGYVAIDRMQTPGSSGMPDSIPLTIIHHADYNYHYQWDDRLTLYGNFASEDIAVSYKNGSYFLLINEYPYPILQDDTIHQLSP